jgi:hypothetical protein
LRSRHSPFQKPPGSIGISLDSLGEQVRRKLSLAFHADWNLLQTGFEVGPRQPQTRLLDPPGSANWAFTSACAPGDDEYVPTSPFSSSTLTHAAGPRSGWPSGVYCGSGSATAPAPASSAASIASMLSSSCLAAPRTAV